MHTQQLSLSLPSRANAILVDTMAVGSLLDRLSRGGYDQRDADDLYELIVQVVLRDRSWWLPVASASHTMSLVKPWFLHGAALWLPRASMARVTRQVSPHAHHDREQLRRASLFVRTALQNELPCLVTADQRPIFRDLAAPELENAVCNLVGQYNSLEQRLHVGMLRRGVSKPHLVRLRIPPLPFEVLRRSRSIEEVISRTLEVRDEYRKLRQDHAELSAILADSTVSPAARTRKITALEESWRAARKLADGAIDVDHGKSGGYVGQLLTSGFQFGAGLALHELGSIVGGAAGMAHAGASLALPDIRYKRAIWRLQPLGSAIRRCWSTSDRDMLSHLERVFGRPRFK